MKEGENAEKDTAMDMAMLIDCDCLSFRQRYVISRSMIYTLKLFVSAQSFQKY